VKARFKGKLRLADLQPPQAYTLQFEAQGGPAGHGKGTAQVRLEPVGPSETRLNYQVNASVGGKVAQIGSRLVDMAAQKMASDFFANFTEQLQARHPAPAAAEAATPAADTAAKGPISRLLAWLRSLFGNSPA
jgi:hypothetical protein